MAWAIPDDIKNLWHSKKTPPTDDKLARFIGTVESQIRHEYGTDINEWIETGALDILHVKDTIAWIVIDYLQTEGKPVASESQSYAGAASRSVAYTTNARTSLRLSGADFAMFRPKYRTVKGSFFSASMAPNKRRFPSLSSYYDYGWVEESAPGENDGGR